MRTIKPFSTISYNTEAYLCNVLDDFVNAGDIYFYTYIKHFPEDDERKEHFHVFIVPNKLTNTDTLRDRLVEPVVDNGKPLGCLPFQSSKFFDWYLYALHDEDYLNAKCQTRKYHYDESELISSDYDIFIQYKHTSDFSRYKKQKQFVQMAESGVPFHALLRNGFVPAQLIFQYREFLTMLRASAEYEASTNRGSSQPHDEI